MPSTEPTLMAINAVRADRAEEFEGWLRSVVQPAVRAHQPHLADRWRVLRSTGADDGVVTFVFVFEGGTDEDWDLRRVLGEALGDEGAEASLARMDEMLTREQDGWWLAPVPLDGG